MELISLIIFIVISLVHVIGEFQDKITIRYITKPLLMPLLGLSYVLGAPVVNFWVVAGLIGGFLGDIFLMIPDPENKGTFFMFGLISFLLGHLFYIIGFFGLAGDFSQFQIPGLVLAVPFILYGIIVYSKLMPYIEKDAPEMKIPVTIYLLIILTMGISTVFSLGNISTPAFITSMVGAYTFILSDTILAFNKFARKIKNDRIYTMISYIIAQFLIVLGFWLASIPFFD